MGRYEFSPRTDTIMYGEELKDGMFVLPDAIYLRGNDSWGGKDENRWQQFAQITKLIKRNSVITFIAVWDDCFQQKTVFHSTHTWIVKKHSHNEIRSSLPPDAVMERITWLEREAIEQREKIERLEKAMDPKYHSDCVFPCFVDHPAYTGKMPWSQPGHNVKRDILEEIQKIADERDRNRSNFRY